MPTYRVDLAYDGSDFHGFARQAKGVRTVQSVLEAALARVMREELHVVVAGRTDAGVHARHQVVSFSAEKELDPKRIARALTSMLRPEIVATSAAIVADGFSARFDATERTYRYHISNREVADPLLRHTTWHVPRHLDVARMDEAARRFVGVHDFSSFCRRRVGGTTLRTVHRASVVRQGELVVFTVSAKAFCHQMVRSLTAFLVDVGLGRRDPDDVGPTLEAADRAVVPSPAPPAGLVLWEVVYG